jgi:hypothetical protein
MVLHGESAAAVRAQFRMMLDKLAANWPPTLGNRLARFCRRVHQLAANFRQLPPTLKLCFNINNIKELWLEKLAANWPPTSLR